MFIADTIAHRLKRGCETMAYPAGPRARAAGPARRRVARRRCKCAEGCGDCVPVCPTQAITQQAGGGIALDLGRCIFCAACVEACPHGAITQTGDHRMAVRRREDLVLGERAGRKSGLPRRSTRNCANSLAARSAAPGQRRRLRRLRGRHQRARHHRLGPRPLRDPICRLAAACGRPADHRAGLAETWSSP